MNRRELITIIGGIAAWPRAARAQHRGKLWRIGLLSGLARPASLESSPFGGLLQGMRALGYVEGKDFVVEFLAKHRLPGMFQSKENVAAGGLMAYGASLPDLFRRAAGYVHRILQGTKPADLPVELPTKFDLAVNLKAAKALGVELPSTFVARADEVIE